jgi:cupin 2 domain-containing protein
MNIFDNIPAHLRAELFETLHQSAQVRIERIVSTGQCTPDGTWYDQEQHEWILLLSGSAGLRFEGKETITLKSGDYSLIEAHQRHRVEWTSTDEPTIWLALFFN